VILLITKNLCFYDFFKKIHVRVLFFFLKFISYLLCLSIFVDWVFYPALIYPNHNGSYFLNQSSICTFAKNFMAQWYYSSHMENLRSNPIKISTI